MQEDDRREVLPPNPCVRARRGSRQASVSSWRQSCARHASYMIDKSACRQRKDIEMSQLKVWGHTRSINVQKVLWSLDELGLPYERIDAGSTFGLVKEPAYLAKNPNGLVPLLEDGADAIWESNAILRYLFARHGKAPLHPESPIARARADAWTEWY